MNEYPLPYNQPPQQPQPYNQPQQEPQQPFIQPQQPPQPFPPQQRYPSQPGVPSHTQYPNYQSGQYPYYQPPPQGGSMMPLPYPPFQAPIPGAGQPKKKHGPWFWILIAFGALIVFSMCIGISQAATQSGAASNTSASATDTLAPTNTPVPTDTPVPSLSPAQVEKMYKAATKPITVVSLDKDGNNDKDKNVYFTCRILKFVKDDSGNTVGANVGASNTYSASVIQIGFPAGTDLTKLNEGDILEVWGTDRGVFSGQNAFGATVQEVGIAAQYMTDTTTNYQTS